MYYVTVQDALQSYSVWVYKCTEISLPMQSMEMEQLLLASPTQLFHKTPWGKFSSGKEMVLVKLISLSGWDYGLCRKTMYPIRRLQVCYRLVVHDVYSYLLFLFKGKSETKADKLRSILAQMEYAYQVCAWDNKGVPFRRHIYVPECHPVTGKVFHKREDEAHVFKVCENDLHVS